QLAKQRALHLLGVRGWRAACGVRPARWLPDDDALGVHSVPEEIQGQGGGRISALRARPQPADRRWYFVGTRRSVQAGGVARRLRGGTVDPADDAILSVPAGRERADTGDL